MKLKHIAKKLGCKLKSSDDIDIHGVSGIEEAKPDELTFLSNPKYVSKLESTKAGAILLSTDAPTTKIPTLISDNPYLSFAKAVELFYQPPELISGIHPTATIADSAVLGENHSIGANVVIGEGVSLGANAVLHPNVTIYPFAKIGKDFIAHSNTVIREYCEIGDRVILQNGAVIGADGFGFAPQKDGRFYKIVQSGITILEDDVEIGANTCIDRATVGETRIQTGTKVDNLVQVGHGSRVGSRTLLAAQVGLAGSTTVGQEVKLAGQVGVAGHLSIGDGVIATAQTGIARSVKAEKTISGTPEMDSALWKRNYIILRELPELTRTVKQLEKKLAEITHRND